MQIDNEVFPILQAPDDILEAIFTQYLRYNYFNEFLLLNQVCKRFNNVLTADTKNILQSFLYFNPLSFLLREKDHHSSFLMNKIISADIAIPKKNNPQIVAIFPELVGYGMLYAPHFRICSAIIQTNLTPETYFVDTEKKALKNFLAQAAENITDETLAKVLYAFLTVKKFDRNTFEQFKDFFTQVNSELSGDKIAGNILSKLSDMFLDYFFFIRDLMFLKILYVRYQSQTNYIFFKNLPNLHLSMDVKNVNFAFAHLDGLVVVGGKNQSRSKINFSYASMKNAFFGHKTQKVSKVAKGNLKQSHFCYADMTGSRFENLKINQVDFRGAITKEILFKNCNLSEIGLSPEERKTPPWNSLSFTEMSKKPVRKKRTIKKKKSAPVTDQHAATETTHHNIEAVVKPFHYQKNNTNSAENPPYYSNIKTIDFDSIRDAQMEIIKQSQEEISELLESSENPENLDLTLLENAFVFDSIEEETEFLNENSVSIEGTRIGFGVGIANKLSFFGMYASKEKLYPPYLYRTENLEENKRTSLQSELRDSQLPASMEVDTSNAPEDAQIDFGQFPASM